MLVRSYLLLLLLCAAGLLRAEDGYDLWLRYKPLKNAAQYRSMISGIYMDTSSPTLKAAAEELSRGLQGLLNEKIPFQSAPRPGSIVVNKVQSDGIYNEGFRIASSNKTITITANTDIGLLYGVFHFLRLLQTQQSIDKLSITSAPRKSLRVLEHWDNLNRYVERGYAGISIWDWHKLPDYIDPRYKDYARANASIGINGVALTNVNANSMVLTPMYLEKVKALADVFRPYGIRVLLTARFSAPEEIGGLKTSDPLNADVQQWWKNKVEEIYKLIPDFGGFVVKANSEGQPGPQSYGRTHADGANMLADALHEDRGVVLWRAFVYSNGAGEDRFKQAYDEFKPLNGKFRNNVIIQVKNGPIDFQPREPIHPLFGAMRQTPLAIEFQLTQEYLGFATHLVYLPVMFSEVLHQDADVGYHGGISVAFVISGMAAVANIGNERNWTGHPFGQANWYAFGRLAWDYNLSEETIAEEWIRQTFTNNKEFVDTVKQIMLHSHEAIVNYMTPLGLHHIMGNGHHYGPAPWYDKAPRADWNPVYFHRADSAGIGFDRTATGSNALAQYPPAIRAYYDTAEKYLLWFHHVRWDHKMNSGRSLWEELCYRYNKGVQDVRHMQAQWNSMEGLIDNERFQQVRMLLNIQEKEAVWWRDACLSYFQTFARKPIPAEYEQPKFTLEYYKQLRFPYAPGN